jgi:hypothetical protein
MGTVTITYDVNKVRLPGKLHCSCGYKFSRVYSGEYTLNPFNKVTSHKENRHNIILRLLELNSTCPKCNAVVSPEKYKWGIPKYMTKEQIIQRLKESRDGTHEGNI